MYCSKAVSNKIMLGRCKNIY